MSNVNVDEVANVTSSSQLLPVKQEVITNCSNHNKSLEICCKTCQELICQRCTVQNQKEHNYDLVNNYYQLKELLATLQKGVVEFCTLIKHII